MTSDMISGIFVWRMRILRAPNAGPATNWPRLYEARTQPRSTGSASESTWKHKDILITNSRRRDKRTPWPFKDPAQEYRIGFRINLEVQRLLVTNCRRRGKRTQWPFKDPAQEYRIGFRINLEVQRLLVTNCRRRGKRTQWPFKDPAQEYRIGFRINLEVQRLLVTNCRRRGKRTQWPFKDPSPRIQDWLPN